MKQHMNRKTTRSKLALIFAKSFAKSLGNTLGEKLGSALWMLIPILLANPQLLNPNNTIDPVPIQVASIITPDNPTGHYS